MIVSGVKTPSANATISINNESVEKVSTWYTNYQQIPASREMFPMIGYGLESWTFFIGTD